MAIIKCPECGHQVSDKAPICPSCGVEIAGKVTRCPECGEIFFKEEAICPSCHRPVRSQSGNLNEATNTTQPAVSEAPKRDITKPQTQEKPVSTPPEPKKKKGGSAALFVSFLIALLVLFCKVTLTPIKMPRKPISMLSRPICSKSSKTTWIGITHTSAIRNRC